MIYIYIICTVLLIMILLIGYYIAYVIYHPNTHSYDETYQIEVDKAHIDIAYYEALNVREVTTENEGLTLHAHYIDQKSDQTILLMHGYTYTRFGSYKYAPMFLEKGFNLLMPDQRFHGKSEGRNTTLGLKESQDCLKWIEYLKANTTTRQIGLHGESMGAATVLHTAKDTSDINFVISDCAFSQFKKQVKYLIWKQNKLPGFFVYIANLFAKKYQSSIIKNNPVESIQHIKVPILLIHGKDDTYIPVEHFVALKKQLKPSDSSALFEGADHAMSYETNPTKYKQIVYTFLKSIQKDPL